MFTVKDGLSSEIFTDTFYSKHKLSIICDIIVTFDFLQYDLHIMDSKVFYLLDLKYEILSPKLETIIIS